VFDHFQEILSSLKQMNMKGSASFDVKMQGSQPKLSIDGKAEIENASLNVPGIVPRVTDLKAQIQFSNDTAALQKASVKMGVSDVEMAGTVKDFAHPVIAFNVRSKLLDVDSLLPQKPQGEETTQAAGKKGDELDLEKSTKGPIAALKANPTARSLNFTGHF